MRFRVVLSQNQFHCVITATLADRNRTKSPYAKTSDHAVNSYLKVLLYTIVLLIHLNAFYNREQILRGTRCINKRE